ncbi:MAG: MoaD/ThiS family protein [Sulfolobales archaeon]
MPKIVVEYLLRFKDLVGKDRDEIVVGRETTIKDLIDMLGMTYGEEFRQEFRNPSGDEVGGRVLIIVNDKVLTDKDLDMKLRDGDVVVLTYVVFGG